MTQKIMKLLATCKEDVSIAAIDFFSFGHALIAYFVYIVFNAILLGIFFSYRNYINLTLIFNYGLIWELIENTVLFNRGIKFGYRKDSILNSCFDVIFFFSGGILAMFNLSQVFIDFLFHTSIFFIGITLLMFLYRRMILNFSKKNN
jgi:hypothetical protein